MTNAAHPHRLRNGKDSNALLAETAGMRTEHLLRKRKFEKFGITAETFVRDLLNRLQERKFTVGHTPVAIANIDLRPRESGSAEEKILHSVVVYASVIPLDHRLGKSIDPLVPTFAKAVRVTHEFRLDRNIERLVRDFDRIIAHDVLAFASQDFPEASPMKRRESDFLSRLWIWLRGEPKTSEELAPVAHTAVLAEENEKFTLEWDRELLGAGRINPANRALAKEGMNFLSEDWSSL